MLVIEASQQEKVAQKVATFAARSFDVATLYNAI